jgi:hypothetical protein
LFDDDPPARGIPQDRLPPSNPPKNLSRDSLPKIAKTPGLVFDPEQFKIVSSRMQAGMMSVAEATEKLNQQMLAWGRAGVGENGPLSQSIHSGIIGRPVAQVPPPPFDAPGFGNHEIEASPSEALDIIVRYLRYVAKERPDDLRQVASKWMTRMTDAVTGVLKEVEKGESE